MIIQAGDLLIELDTGTNSQKSILQRYQNGNWENFSLGGQFLDLPRDIDNLPPGKYRLTGLGLSEYEED